MEPQTHRATTSRIAALSIAAVLAVIASGPLIAQELGTPPFAPRTTKLPVGPWPTPTPPAEHGWSIERLTNAESFYEDLDSAAVAVVHRGVLIAAWGDVAKRFNTGSIRKPLFGAILGQEVVEGRLDVDATLGDLEIDDRFHPLTDAEKEARVIDLLQSRGAIYLPAVYESPSWKRHKPERGTHAPGERWFYSNWGFNALGTILEQTSKTPLPEAFLHRIAEPIGMQDFRTKDVHYLRATDLTERAQANESEHPAGVFMMSTRDLARFGLLYLNGGRWNDEHVVPRAWVERSLTDHVATHPAMGGDRYGYLWWVSPPDSALGEIVGHTTYKATGGRGHKVVLVPELDLVVAHQPGTGGVGLLSQLKRRFIGAPGVTNDEFNELMRRIVAAHPSNQ